MAELFGVASGALSVVGFAGQLAQGSSYLHGVLRSIKHAPEEVNRLADELAVLGAVLAGIRNPQNAIRLGQVLQHVSRQLGQLRAFLDKVQSGMQRSRKSRMWSRFRWVLRKEDVAKILGELERSKMMLLQACGIADRYGLNQLCS
jgi:hypothetical protein